jgi:tRNA threonylcarbamoyladenosine biosynthesis protein TsaB
VKRGCVLAIDCAFGPLSVAVADGGRVLAAVEGGAQARAAEDLPALAARAMADAGVSVAGLSRLAVTVGPGGFTSLRAGLAFAKGLAFAAERPLLGFTTLEALAARAARESPGARAYAAAIDAKRGEVFWQVFGGDLAPLTPAQVSAASALIDLYAWSALLPLTVLAGSAAPVLSGFLPGALLLPITVPDAAALALHAARFEPDARPAQAVYLRPADARPSP